MSSEDPYTGRVRLAGGPSHAYQQSCEEETSHHNITTSSTHYCAFDSVAHERLSGQRPREWHHRSATYPSLNLGDPHPGIRRGDSVLNDQYISAFAHQEGKPVKVLGLDGWLRGGNSIRAALAPPSPNHSRCGTIEEEVEEPRCRDRIMRSVKGGLEWALAGRAGTGSLDPRYETRRREGRDERLAWEGGEESGQRREMRERWRRGLMEEEAKIGRRVGRR